MATQRKRALLAKNQTQRNLIFSLFCILCSLTFSSQALAMSERERNIKSAGELKVCIWPDYFSISYKNQKSGLLEGIDIDLSREFAQDLGVEVKYVATHFGIFMEDIQQDNCDIAMFGVGTTPERAKIIDFSEPYLSSSMYGIASRTNPLVDSWQDIDQPEVVVCVQEGTYMENAMITSLQNAQLMRVVKSSQRELEVRSGRADVFIADYPYAQKMLQVYDWAKILEPIGTTEQIQYAYAVKKGQTDWLMRVNDFVIAIKKDGRLKQYAQKNRLQPIALVGP